MVGGSGVLKGSKGWGSKLKGVVLEFGRGVMEEVDFSRLEIMIELTFFEKFYTLPQNHGFVHTRSIRTFLGFWRKKIQVLLG